MIWYIHAVVDAEIEEAQAGVAAVAQVPLTRRRCVGSRTAFGTLCRWYVGIGCYQFVFIT